MCYCLESGYIHEKDHVWREEIRNSVLAIVHLRYLCETQCGDSGQAVMYVEITLKSGDAQI